MMNSLHRQYQLSLYSVTNILDDKYKLLSSVTSRDSWEQEHSSCRELSSLKSISYDIHLIAEAAVGML